MSKPYGWGSLKGPENKPEHQSKENVKVQDAIPRRERKTAESFSKGRPKTKEGKEMGKKWKKREWGKNSKKNVVGG